MKYRNNSLQNRLVSVNRINKWIKPREVIELSDSDAKFLGANAAFVKPFVPKQDKAPKIAPPVPQKPTSIKTKK
jgi:hypothetical protein